MGSLLNPLKVPRGIRSSYLPVLMTWLMLVFGSPLAYGQISPGDLTNSHSNLEGMSNCTQCHDIGRKVTNAKCLACHTEIQSGIDRNKGYHVSPEVIKQDCFECHSEHHGRNFEMIRFDQNNFNHDLTGYVLEGQHQAADCRACHRSEFISDRELKSREGSFLGLDQACLSCHEDYHQGSLSNNCLDCHSMNGFLPVTNFDHNETAFPLEGAHLQIECNACHEVGQQNGTTYQVFTPLEHSDCKSCHTDPHQGGLPGSCASCHTEASFNQLSGVGRFDHRSTGFILKGEHKVIDCFSCHEMNTDPRTVFKNELQGLEEESCVSCHQDVHQGKFGLDCAQCHSESDFLALNNMDLFDHDITDFPLEGRHIAVDCRECHVDRFSTPIDFTNCSSCHEDYHQGEFTRSNPDRDCLDCHTLEQGFDYTLFSTDDHQSTDFPLDGGHLATPCFSCHVDEASERWTFVNVGNECVDCHNDVHSGLLDESYYPQQDCSSCHSKENWKQVTFDHDRTNWPLSGKHLQIDCRECHFEFDTNNSLISQQFSNLETSCASCHDNIHGDQFAVNGITDCNRCHVTTSWTPEKFDHDTTSFPLEGRHLTVSCNACHQIQDERGMSKIVYKLNTTQCIDCHQ